MIRSHSDQRLLPRLVSPHGEISGPMGPGPSGPAIPRALRSAPGPNSFPSSRQNSPQNSPQYSPQNPPQNSSHRNITPNSQSASSNFSNSSLSQALSLRHSPVLQYRPASAGLASEFAALSLQKTPPKSARLVRSLLSSARPDRRPQSKSAPVEDLSELQYLVTYDLVNNFYYNLVSWSVNKNSIAIAIDCKVYWWDGDCCVEEMPTQYSGKDPITCIKCSGGNSVAVGYLDGYFCVYSAAGKLRAQQSFASPVYCVEWFPDGRFLVVGTSLGGVYLMKYDGCKLRPVRKLAGFSQHICGISINYDCTQVAVGGNQNLAIVWNITDKYNPVEACRLSHRSAVKGIQFCPWAPGLLATGGGSNDRTLRFWHTGSGTLLSSVDTDRQITGIFWSSFHKQLTVTFGFASGDENVVAAVYRYPENELVARAVAKDPLRALSATVAPGETRIAVAANDGTVRVYKLWEARVYPLTRAPSSNGMGSYTSAIVENCEGIDPCRVVLR